MNKQSSIISATVMSSFTESVPVGTSTGPTELGLGIEQPNTDLRMERTRFSDGAASRRHVKIKMVCARVDESFH